MAYIIKAHYYADPDQFGESFVLTSDNGDKDLPLEIGRKVKIVPICSCGEDATNILHGFGMSGQFCDDCLLKTNG